MVRFLDTAGINNEISQILKKAEDFVYILSPYLKICDKFRIELEDKNRIRTPTQIIYGKADLQPSVSDWLNSMSSIRVSFCKNLHAKCYMNENAAVITSMNMYEYSQINNEEMGILITREDDPEVYEDIKKEVKRIVRISKEVKLSVTKVPEEEKKKKEEPIEKPSSPLKSLTKGILGNLTKPSGYCIRCSERIPYNPEIPYCENCFKSWNRWKNNSYEEKNGVCHNCGKPFIATKSKPLCRYCK